MWPKPFAAVAPRTSGGCRWIAGDPKGRARDDDLFCGAPCAEGESYCPEHRARAYVPLRVWREKNSAFD